ncbi:MAG: NAD(P)H-dependent oxidoreductase subunit E [Tepidisphaeraceae bacterium]
MQLEELKDKADELHAKHKGKHCLRVCMGTGCLSSKSDQIKTALETEVKSAGCGDTVEVKRVGCFGLCAMGPMVSVDDGKTLYKSVTPDNAQAIVQGVQNERPVQHLVCDTNVPFFQRQQKIVLENAGRVDPEDVEDYIASGGYQALLKAVTEMTPAQVVEQITISGLRGAAARASRRA